MTSRETAEKPRLSEIVDERTAATPPSRPRRRASVGAVAERLRGLVESAYVLVAGGAMKRLEQVEDARALQRYQARRRVQEGLHRSAERKVRTLAPADEG